MPSLDMSPLRICLGKVEVALAKAPPEIDAAKTACDRYFAEQIAAAEPQRNVLDMPLGETALSTRTINFLEGAGIKTVRALLMQRREQLLAIPSVGTSTLAEILSALEKLGFHAKPAPKS